jgi:hypothetical protein
VCGGGASIEEQVFILGSVVSWGNIEKKQGVAEVSNIRPHPVLALSDKPVISDETLLDLYLSFDEGQPGRFADSMGRYEVLASAEMASVSAPWSRKGNGAALFNGSGRDPVVLKPGREALFAPGNYLRDFTIEFWVYPQNLENGEQVLSWNSSKVNAGVYSGTPLLIDQSISCTISKNRFNWAFSDFFFSPGGMDRKSLSFSGPVLLNRTWSHHLIRFDADLGLLEYLVDGKTESIVYSTSTGREGGEVYTPIIGENSRLVLGSRFIGMMDEFRIYSCFVEKAVLAKYPAYGGRVETRALDLGYANSKLLKIEAYGGLSENLRAVNSAGKQRNEYAGNGVLRFQDHAEVKLFVRISNDAFHWNEIPWIPVNPGAELNSLRGRYVQFAADFYPGENGESSPYLSELRIVYQTAEPPSPPTQVFAAAKDGAVELSWKASPARDLGGYLVYYGTAKGEYLEAKSPLDAGDRTSIRIEGLSNGTLYYFAVAAYRKSDSPLYDFVSEYNVPEPGRLALEPGEFSREAAARPLRMAQ